MITGASALAQLVRYDLYLDASDDRPLTRPRWRADGRSPAGGEAVWTILGWGETV